MPSLRDRVGELPWYHTIVLPEGVVTPGYYDTVAGARRVPLPDSLVGKRCLDIASANGFWAFELERRGAREVVTIDLPSDEQLDWSGSAVDSGQPGFELLRVGFELAREALDSTVERLELSVYDLSPARLGRFDFVFIGNVLLHLRDPIGALDATRSVVAGELLSVDAVSLIATLKSPRKPIATLSRRLDYPWWWTPNRPALRLYLEQAGYDVIDAGGPFFFPYGEGFPQRPPLRERLRSISELWFWTVLHRLGAPSAWVRAVPSSRGAGETEPRGERVAPR